MCILKLIDFSTHRMLISEMIIRVFMWVPLLQHWVADAVIHKKKNKKKTITFKIIPQSATSNTDVRRIIICILQSQKSHTDAEWKLNFPLP